VPEFVVDGLVTRWVEDGDEGPRLVLGHGAGAPLDSPFMQHVAEALAARGLRVVRFHFPYMERAQREGRRRPPDRMPRLVATWRALLERLEPGPLAIGGKSMGGRAASELLASDDPPSNARCAVYLGYPLHPPGKPERRRDAHLPAVRVSQLFVQGERDALGTADEVAEVVGALEKATLLRVPRGDHSLAPSRRRPFDGADVWLDAIASFVRRRIRRPAAGR
jgi:predicted alpha/beta-hydrolase family hydrolase